MSLINLPNAITIARILAVPLMIWLIVSGDYLAAFWVFVLAGISDGVDGFIAKRFGLQTELGAYLDPLADKLLLVSIFVSLGMLRVLPAWVVILVVSRDILIVGGQIIDGTGSPWFWGDLAVQNGRIVDIGKLAGSSAADDLADRLR